MLTVYNKLENLVNLCCLNRIYFRSTGLRLKGKYSDITGGVIYKSAACVFKRKAEALEHALYPTGSLIENCWFRVEIYNFVIFC